MQLHHHIHILIATSTELYTYIRSTFELISFVELRILLLVYWNFHERSEQNLVAK